MKKLLLVWLTVLTAAGAAGALEQQFIFPLQDKHVHASSIVETPGGDLLAAWFHGSGERTADDVRIQGARLRNGASEWSPVFDMADTPEFPDCNPVLFIDSQERLWLFWVVVLANGWENCLLKYRRADAYTADGPPEWDWQDVIPIRPGDAFPEQIAAAFQEINPPEEMWAEYAPPYSQLLMEASHDKLKRQLGWMTRNHLLVLPSGRMLLPLYSDGFNVCLMARSDDQGATWQASNAIVGLGPIQPTLAPRQDGSLAAYFRDSGDVPKRVQYAESSDEGITWTVTRDTEIPNPSSSLEVLALTDGRWVLIGNDLEDGRHRLGVFLSKDEGKTWPAVRYLEDDANTSNAYGYPSILQAANGMLHATYSYHTAEGKTIKHVAFAPDWIETPDAPAAPPEAAPAAPAEPQPQPEMPAAAPEVVVPAPPEPQPQPEMPAAPAAAPAAGPPDGMSLLQQSAAALAAQEALAFDFNAKFTYTRKSISQDAFMEGNVMLGKGNLGMIHVKRQDSDTITYNNAKGRVAFAPSLNRYSPLPVVASRRELVATMTPGTVEAILSLLGDMFEGKAPALDSVSAAPGKRADAATWELQAESPDYSLQATLSGTEPPTITSLTMTFKESLITKYKFPPDASLAITIDFSGWQLGIAPPDSTFEFVPSPGAEQTGLEELSLKPKIEEGQPAPDFSLEQMGGGSFRLKDRIGKEVILLEFWATHCTVCQQLSPVLDEFAKSLAGQEVGIYSINLRETPEQIQMFLKDKIPAYPILLDKNGQIGALYQATGIPKMVLIGKDGLIKAVYKGMPNALIEHLTGRIQGLLQGAPDPLPPTSMIVEGAPAPDFSLEQLGGGTMQLADNFGDKVIVLGFWATTCGYCTRALPIVTEVIKNFLDRGVVFYGVNQREAPEKIQPYLEKAGLNIPVLLDRTAQTGALYEVKGIPKFVVIGKDGLIKAVHQGLRPNLAELLTGQLETLAQ